MSDKGHVKKKKYDEQRIVSAIAAVRNGESFRRAASRFEIPASTLRDIQRASILQGPLLA